jgi:PAS domain S-box-containing protein
MSIRSKLTILFLSIASIPFLLVSMVTYTNFKNSLETNRLEQLKDLTVFRAERIEAYFAGLKADMTLAQSSYNTRENLPVLTRLADHTDNPEYIAASKTLNEQLRRMQSVAAMADILLIGPNCKAAYSNRPSHKAIDFSKGTAIERKAFEKGKTGVYFSDVYFDETEDKRFEMLITAPDTGLDGAFVGVIVFEVDMTPIYNLIQDRTGLGSTGEVLVAEKAGNQVIFLNPLRHDSAAALKRKVTLGEVTGFPIQQAVQGRTGAGRAIDYRGKQVVAAWRYIPSLNWGIVAKIDEQEAFSDVTNLRNLVVIILIIVFVLSSIMAFSIAQSISLPIKKLTIGAEIIGRGNLDYRVGTTMKDEIGKLSRSFDKMTHDLKTTIASRDELNREVAERKKTEDALRRAKEEWERTFDSVPDQIVIMDCGHKIVRVNNAFAKQIGRTPEEFVGRYCYQVVHGTDAPPLLCPHELMLKDKRGHSAEIHEKSLGGDFLISVTPLFDHDGKMFGSVHVARDITEQKAAEEGLKRAGEELEKKVHLRTAELKAANELLRLEITERTRAEEAVAKRQQVLESIYAIETTFSTSLENTYDQVVLTIASILDVNYAAIAQIEKGTFTALSQVTEKKLSHDKSIPVEKHPCGIVYRERKLCQYAGTLAGMFPAPTQKNSASADYKSYVGMPVLSKNGSIVGIICAMGTMERTYSDFELHLIEIVARYISHEIDHVLMEKQLSSSREMNLLGRIASGVAHEVRNPLNGILAISEALFQEIGDNPEYLPYLQHIKNQVTRLSLLMKDLLDLGKPLVQSELTPQPLEPLLRAAIDSLKHSSSHKNRSVRFAPVAAGAPAVVAGDAVKLQQVFFNLIDNACDHSPPDTAVTVELAGATNSDAVVRVIDEGNGVAPDLLPRIFDPFFTTRKGGTGLGLSIVKHIVEMHGGTINMTNNVPPPGLTAEVRFPLASGS